MTQWKILPSGVDGVLTTVQEQAPAITAVVSEGTLEDLQSQMDVASSATGVAAAAVLHLAQDVVTSVDAIQARVAAGVLGVAEATIAYNQGQLEMAGEFEGQISSAASGDLGYFEQHGALNYAG